MAAKQMEYSADARQLILKGVGKLAKAVKATLGPKGRNAMLSKKWGAPTITKDGVTVAKEIELEDPYENMGAQLVLAEAIFREGVKNVAAGANAMDIKRGLDAAVETIVGELQSLSKACNDKKEIAQIGIISANNDVAVGDLIAEAMEKVGKDGVITVEEAKSLTTTLDVV